MALFLSKEDILGPAQQVAAAAGQARPMGAPGMAPADALGGLNNALGSGNNALGQVVQALGSIDSILKTAQQIRGSALTAQADASAQAGTIQGAAREIADSPITAPPQLPPPPQQKPQVQPMNITPNEAGIAAFLDATFSELENMSDADKKKTIADILVMWKTPVVKDMMRGKLAEAIRKALPGLVVLK
jgi:hypothetical protein